MTITIIRPGTRILTVGSRGVRISQPGGAAAIPWYLSGGIPAANCVAAYNAKSAASLADSYVNLNAPGVNNAAPGVAPTWATGTGWTFNGSTQWLIVGSVVPTNNQTWSYIVRFSGASNTGSLGGTGTGSNPYISLQPFRGPGTGRSYSNGGELVFAGAYASGIMAVAGNACYINGAPEPGPIPTTAGVLPGFGIGRTHIGGTYIAANIQACAIYQTMPLSAAQVLAVSTAMAAL